MPSLAVSASFAVPVLALGVVLAATWNFSKLPVLFLGHIAAMLVCWAMMSSGSVLYAASRLYPVSGKLREKVRTLHAAVQSFACLFAAVGYACIYKNHLLMGASQFGFDPGNPAGKTVHALLGYVVLIGMLVQSSQGWTKYMGLQKGKLRALSHPLYGRILVVVMSANIVIVLTTFPLASTMFWGLCGAVGAVAIATFLVAGPCGKPVSARELPLGLEDCGAAESQHFHLLAGEEE